MADASLFRTSAGRRFDGGASDVEFSPARPAHWALVVGALGLLAAGLVWSIFGTASSSVSARGYLLPESGFYVVANVAPGTVSETTVEPGDRIDVGDTVALIASSTESFALTSLVAGVVESVQRNVGDWVEAGETIVIVEPNEPTVVYAFVPIDQASLVDEGMPAHISFAAHPPAQYGTIHGTVAAIAELAATPASLETVLHDQALIDDVASAGPVIQVMIAVDSADLEEFSRRLETPIRLASPVAARILIEESAPIDHLLG